MWRDEWNESESIRNSFSYIIRIYKILFLFIPWQIKCNMRNLKNEINIQIYIFLGERKTRVILKFHERKELQCGEYLNGVSKIFGLGLLCIHDLAWIFWSYLQSYLHDNIVKCFKISESARKRMTMSHSVTIRTQTVTSSSTAVIINTGYLKTWSGLFKLFELVSSHIRNISRYTLYN